MRLETPKRQLFAPIVSSAYTIVSSHASPVSFQALGIRGRMADIGMIYRWTFGSILFLASWAVLMGPVTYAKHLISGPRLPFSAAYFGSIALTLFFAIKVRPLPTLHLRYDVCDYQPCLRRYSFSSHLQWLEPQAQVG